MAAAKETTTPKGAAQEIHKEAGKLNSPVNKEIPAEGSMGLLNFDQFAKSAGQLVGESEETKYSSSDLVDVAPESEHGGGKTPETGKPKGTPAEIPADAGKMTDETPITPGSRMQSFAEFSRTANGMVGEAEETKFSKGDLTTVAPEANHGGGKAPETMTPKEKPNEVASDAGKMTDETPITPGSHVQSFAEFSKSADQLVGESFGDSSREYEAGMPVHIDFNGAAHVSSKDRNWQAALKSYAMMAKTTPFVIVQDLGDSVWVQPHVPNDDFEEVAKNPRDVGLIIPKDYLSFGREEELYA